MWVSVSGFLHRTHTLYNKLNELKTVLCSDQTIYPPLHDVSRLGLILFFYRRHLRERASAKYDRFPSHRKFELYSFIDLFILRSSVVQSSVSQNYFAITSPNSRVHELSTPAPLTHTHTTIKHFFVPHSLFATCHKKSIRETLDRN